MQRIEVLGCPMDAATLEETVDLIRESVGRGHFTQHVVVNAAKLVNMRHDSQLRESVECCDVINIDGMGVVWGARLLGHRVPERVAGVDLFLELLKMSEANDFPVFFLGATDDVISKVVGTIEQKHPKLVVAGFRNGYFWEDELGVVDQIRLSGAKLLFVGISSPHKEVFINRWRNQLGVSFVMGVGGAFDVVAGKVSRAPPWMQRVGLEWLFRVIQEPKRMWRRYLLTNSEFIWLLLREWAFK